jgi:glycogenin glucosyltransferase
MNCSYVSLLTTDRYVPGARVLHHSLKTRSQYPFLLLITPNISEPARQELARSGIRYAVVHPIANPTGVKWGHRWFYNYSKLHIFGLLGLDKIVFLDADMLVTQNIDDLFQRPHMSAVNAGGLLPEKKSWIQFNGGLLVVEPSPALFQDMLAKVGAIEGGRRGGDQGFLHAYYSRWPEQGELHLDHRYNLFHVHLDRHHELFNWSLEDMKVIHYASEVKPWSPARSDPPAWKRVARGLKPWLTGTVVSPPGPLHDAALRLWHRTYGESGPMEMSK